MANKLTIYEIARLAGVSKSTVSRVLNQRNDVDAATRDHVLRVMEEHGFVPSLNASGLKGRKQFIGVLVPTLTWTLITDTLLGAANVLEASSYEIVLYTCPPENEYDELLKRVDRAGLIAGIVAVIHNQSPDPLIAMHQKNIPTVVINAPGYDLPIPWVGADNVGGGYRATQHLLELGHRRIGYINGPVRFPCSAERYQGYCQALQEAGITPDPTLVLPSDFTVGQGSVCAEQFFAMSEPPTAIFAGNDATAHGVLLAAEAKGLNVPDDVALVGFDDTSPSAFLRPALTTVRQPFIDMGRCAAELLLSLLNPSYTFPEQWLPYAIPSGTSAQSNQEECAPHKFQLPTPLVVRASSGVPYVMTVPTHFG